MVSLLRLPKVIGRTSLARSTIFLKIKDGSFPAPIHITRELAESVLAHVLKDKTEAAYQCGDMLDKRCELMESWASYITGPKGKVLSIHTKVG